jgi:hypothetical protein
MKKIIITICAAVAMFTVVSCGESNPAIKAGKEFIDNPTPENFEAYAESIDSLPEKEEREYKIWSQENEEKLYEALESVFIKMDEEMDEAAGSKRILSEIPAESIEEVAKSMDKKSEE